MSVGGRYRLTKGPIRSRTSEVWLARDEKLGRGVVLKRMLTGHDSVRGFSALQAEARALARFNHPHIVTLFDAVQAGRGRRATSWLVMEHVSGGSLYGRPAVPPEVAASVGAQVAGALVVLHAEGIVHGDIKPGNVVVTGDGTVKLADFGAAYRVGGQETITPNNAISYTPDYAAPEVIRGRLVRGSDVFSLGAMLYALVAGSPPRRGSGSLAAQGRVTLEADLGVLDGVVRAMLSKDPEDRPVAAEVVRRMTEIAGDTTAAALARDTDDFWTAGEAVAGPGSVLVAAVRNHPRATGVTVGALVVVAVVLSIAQPRPEPGKGGRPGAEAQKAGSVIGDPRTIDPCALTDAAALGGFGDTQLDPSYGGFDRCDVLVDPPDGDVVDVNVDFNRDPDTEQPSPVRAVGRVRIVEHRPESDSCQRTLLLDGDRDLNVLVTAKREEGGRDALCAMADVATGSAVAVLNRGPLPRRTIPPRSLAHKDACALLPARALEVIPGIDANSPEAGFGSWQCAWESTTSKLWLDVRFDQGRPPNAADGSATRLNGYRAYLFPDDGDCLGQLVYRTYTNRIGRMAETLNVRVTGSGSADRLCGLARRLTGSAAVSLGTGPETGNGS
ncbi:serine/threonine-protein kinase [Nonomuraea typhae]|uniref:serine/threonine-protein kinase n=1 Tax=Nonomuraea typhae TaxID=2603600 RepID=UPI0015E1E4DA|nr:serine/threonine-protein kinase [Nonomuraea typhae]